MRVAHFDPKQMAPPMRVAHFSQATLTFTLRGACFGNRDHKTQNYSMRFALGKKQRRKQGFLARPVVTTWRVGSKTRKWAGKVVRCHFPEAPTKT